VGRFGELVIQLEINFSLVLYAASCTLSGAQCAEEDGRLRGLRENSGERGRPELIICLDNSMELRCGVLDRLGKRPTNKRADVAGSGRGEELLEDL
jgi:hypothetical protein